MELPKREEEILRHWKKIRAFERSVENRPKGRNFVFYEGPPTANGRPGIHHFFTRAFKDIILRYKTMQGYRVERKAGWDTHGLPVEVEVEKELGLHNKKEIEKYGVAEFNQKCRESVWKYKKEWDSMTERMGFWIDLANPYITYDPLYMETLWWIIKQAHNKNLLYEGHRVAPYCPRCGTSLSSHEVAQGYEDVTEDSVYVKFRIKDGFRLGGKTAHNTFLLAWTTTPWTLPGNAALAVGEKIDYVLVKQEKEYYVLAKERLSILKGEYEIVKEFKGKEMKDITYKPIFDIKELISKESYKVYAADFVTTEEGTGIVHTAVMYGEDDYKLGEKLDLPKVHTVDEAGRFNKLMPQWRGKFVKDVEIDIIVDLKKRGLLYKKEKYTHSYPFCWRCKTPLLYYAMQSWFIKMSSLRDKLIASNKKINWMPAHIKEGRFGEWLRELKDWNFSRSRYWGTPLPVWRCSKCEHIEVIGSREDLKNQNFSTNKFFYLRHGESEKNHKNIVSSRWPETKKFHLTKKGIEDVKKTSKALKKNGGVDFIFASDFTRTKETAEIVGKELGVKVVYDKRLREYDLGNYDGRPLKEFIRDFPDLKERFSKKPPKGETSAELQRRAFDFISSINKEYKNKKILIVSHGDTLWVAESRMNGLTIEEAAAIKKKGSNYPKRGALREFIFRNLPYNNEGELDLHRPFVDEITFLCAKCESGYTKRVEDLIDGWFDSGSMPFASATQKATAGRGGKITPPEPFPADYIVEAIDQTRGWFYSLLAVSTILGLRSPYKNVISLGHVLDREGKKMSKSRGNVISSQEMMDKYGADATRWYFYTLNQPWDYKNFDEADLQKSYRRFVSTLANVLEFYKTYKSNKIQRIYKAHNFLDRWVLSRLNSVTSDVTKKLNNYDITTAARTIENFVIDDISNWYVRRSRRRFQNPGNSDEKNSAESMLAHILSEISKLAAPFIPFLSEEIYSRTKNTSVHWEKYPLASKRLINKSLEEKMKKARKIVEMVHEIRAQEGIRVRQPLAALRVNIKMPRELHVIVGEEVNVKGVGYRTSAVRGWKTKKEGGIVVSLDTRITPVLLGEGFINEFIRNVQELRKSAGLVPKDKIELRYKAEINLSDTLKRSKKQIESQSNAKVIVGGAKKEAFLSEKEFAWENKKVWMGIKKT